MVVKNSKKVVDSATDGWEEEDDQVDGRMIPLVDQLEAVEWGKTCAFIDQGLQWLEEDPYVQPPTPPRPNKKARTVPPRALVVREVAPAIPNVNNIQLFAVPVDTPNRNLVEMGDDIRRQNFINGQNADLLAGKGYQPPAGGLPKNLFLKPIRPSDYY
jgi:hypothetical protein